VVLSTSGGVAPRGLRISAEPRQLQAQHTGDMQVRKRRDTAVKTFQTLCRTACAGEAAARQALARVAHDGPAPCPHESTVGPTPRDGTRGRPGPGVQPPPLVYSLAGALASRVAARQALVDQQRGCILATHELAEAPLPAHAGLDGDTGQAHAERGFRFLKAPQF